MSSNTQIHPKGSTNFVNTNGKKKNLKKKKTKKKSKFQTDLNKLRQSKSFRRLGDNLYMD